MGKDLEKMLKSKIRRLLYRRWYQLIQSIRTSNLTYLEDDALFDLMYAVNKIEINKINGEIIEAGVALGGSAIAISKAKKQNRRLCLYDVYDMIPPPGENDEMDVKDRYNEIVSGESKGINGDVYYGYQNDLEKIVIRNLENFSISLTENNVKLIKGLFQDKMSLSEPVALAHIDGDWYESVYFCLKTIFPKLSYGGSIIIDDYFSWSGCKKAVDDYLKNLSNDEFVLVKKSRLHIVKIEK